MRSLCMDPEEAGFPPLTADLEVDVAVVGAGFSGLGAAWALRCSGARVAVLEARTVASGASGRNAGFVLAGPAMSFDASVAMLGPQRARALWEFTEENHRILSGLIEEFDIECGYLRRGSMSVAQSEREWSDMLRTADALRSAGIAACLVPNAGLPRPFDRMYRGGIYYGGNGELDPGRLLRGLAPRIEHVSIFERSPVQTLHRLAGRWHLRTDRATVRTHRLLLASNAYTPALWPGTPIVARRGQVLATAPFPRTIVPFPMYGNDGYQYWRQTAEGRLVVGGWRDLDPEREVGTDETLHPEIQETLDRFTGHVVGPGPEVQERWAGIMGFTPDMLPIAGAVDAAADLWVAAGYSGHGVAMAFNTGAHTARALLGIDHALPACFDPHRPALAPARAGAQ